MVRRHAAQSPVSCEFPISIFDAHESCEQPAECERSEGDMPDAIVDVLEADIFANADACNVDPLRVPPDATVGADVPHLEAVRISQGRPCDGDLPRENPIA